MIIMEEVTGIIITEQGMEEIEIEIETVIETVIVIGIEIETEDMGEMIEMEEMEEIEIEDIMIIIILGRIIIHHRDVLDVINVNYRILHVQDQHQDHIREADHVRDHLHIRMILMEEEEDIDDIEDEVCL